MIQKINEYKIRDSHVLNTPQKDPRVKANFEPFLIQLRRVLVIIEALESKIAEAIV